MARVASGIDVGSRSAIVVRGRPKGNTFALTGFHAASLRGDARTLAEAWASLRPPFRPGRSVVGLSGRGLNIRYTQVPRLRDWQLRKLMQFEVSEIGGQAGSEMASDFNVLPEIPEIEGEDVVLLAMAREELLAECRAGLRAAGGRLESFTPNAIALYNAWLCYGVVEDDTVLVANVGHENIDVAIVRGTDLVFARNLAGGAGAFDAAIAERFGIDLERAEAVKAELASLRPEALSAGGNREKASRAVQGPAGELLGLLQSAVLFCKTQIKLAGLRVDRVALCGGGAALPGLDEYLRSAMRIPVETFDAFRVVDTSALSPAEADLLEEYRLEAVVALGLATGATRDETYSIEIVPADVERRRNLYGRTLLLVAAVVLCLAWLGARAAALSGDLETTLADVRRLESTLQRARSADRETRELLDANAELEETALELWLAAGAGEQLARSLAALQEELPEDFWLVELESRYTVSDALGIERQRPRPLLHLEGRVREGTRTPSAQFEDFLARLGARLEGARMVPGLSPSGDRFTLDLSLVAPEPADAADEEEG